VEAGLHIQHLRCRSTTGTAKMRARPAMWSDRFGGKYPGDLHDGLALACTSLSLDSGSAGKHGCRQSPL
jgi:hypothetical protein